jgi:DNA-binding transcriptional LysR family regulator
MKSPFRTAQYAGKCPFVAARLRIAFHAVPFARWGPLFHVLRVEQPDLELQFRAVEFPLSGRSLLQDADVGLFVAPTAEPGLDALTIESSPMLVALAPGHRLASHDELRVVEILSETFIGAPRLNPRWRAFWTLDAARGGPPAATDDDVRNMQQALAVVASGRAIGTVSATTASGLTHPGVVTIPLRDGPRVPTCLVWPTAGAHPAVAGLIDLARAMTGGIGPGGDG